MAISEILGLFTSPQQYQQNQLAQFQNRAAQEVQMNPFQQAALGARTAGYQLGQGIGGALGGQDPQLQKITQRQQIIGMIDPNNPDSYPQAIQAALQVGDQEAAFLLRNEMMRVQQQLLVRQDEALVRQDLATKRKSEADALIQAQNAQRISSNAYLPSTPEQQPFFEVDDQGMRVAPIPAQPASFDIQRVAPELMRTPAGRVELERLLKADSLTRPEYKVAGDVLYEIPKFGDGKVKPVSETARKTITIGNRVLDSKTMDVLYTAPDAPPAALAEWKAFSALPKNEQQSFLKLQAAKRPDTTINMPNQDERKAATLANRLNFSVDQINQAIGIDPSAAMPTTSVEIARFLSRTEMLPNKLTSAQRQIVESAQLDILDAALTLGTGAAYTQEQLESYRKAYFPQIGDKPENVAAKRARLQNILQSAAIASGRAKVPTPIPSSNANLDSIITAPPSN